MIPYRTFFKVRFVNIGFTEDIVNGPFLSFFYERGEQKGPKNAVTRVLIASIVRERTPPFSRMTIHCHQQ